MSTSPDSLARALDAAIGDGPPLPPVEAHLVAGRRVVRRRRVVSGLTAAAVVAVLGTTYAVAGSALDGSGDPVPVAPVPATVSAAPSPGPRGPVPTTDPDLFRGADPVGYNSSGDLVVQTGSVVVDYIADPLPPPPGGRTDAVALREGGQVRYYLLERQQDRWSVGSGAGRDARFPTLASWVAFQPSFVEGGTDSAGPGRP